MAEPPTTTSSIPRSRKMAETRLAIFRCLSVGSVSAVMSARADWIWPIVMCAGCIHEPADVHELQIRVGLAYLFPPTSLRLIVFHPDAGAHHVAVAEDVVHAADGRPVFGVAQALQRIRGLGAGVGAVPIVAGDDVRG